MADAAPNLDLPYLAAGQAGKHITHNEALRILDALAVLSVKDRTRAAPPASPADGDRHLIAASPTGPWAGQAGKLAAWQDGGWAFYAPKEGWRAWVADEGKLLAFSGTSWVPVAPAPNPAALVGVNATADATNRLSVTSPASLFRHDGAGHQLKIDKASSAETASVLFQTGASGRAEIGLTGDNRLHVKASADGTVWKDLLVVDPTADRVQLPLAGGSLRIDALGSGGVLFADANRDVRTSAGMSFNASLNQLTLSGDAAHVPLALSSATDWTGIALSCSASPTRNGVLALNSNGSIVVVGDSTSGALYVYSAWGFCLRTPDGSPCANLTSDGRAELYGDTLRLHAARTPASASAPGLAGEICWDSGHVYVCVAANSWKRAALSSW